jgi:tetratricopeptide (TPR) repeat protein
MFRKIAIALLFLGIVFPVKADEQPLDLESFGLIPSERKKDMPKGKNPFELIPIEQNSDSKLTQKENYEDIYIDKAKNYIDKKEYEKAIDFLDKAIVLYPKNSQLYGLRANSYVELNQYEKAVEDYTKAINLDSQRPYSYGLRGASYAELNQYEKAVEDYTKAINLYPQETLFYIARAKAYKELKQDDKMELDLIKARELLSQDNTEEENTKSQNQGNDDAYFFNLGIESIDKKDYKKAIESLDKAISLNPQNPDSYYWRGSAYGNLNQYEKAIIDYTKSVSLNPQDALVYSSRGYAYTELKQHEKAINDYTQAIKLEPNEAIFYYLRGTSYLSLKQYQKAILDYTKVISLNPQDASAYYARGVSYNDFGEYQKAKLDLIKASELYKKTGDIDSYNDTQEILKIIEDNSSSSVRTLTPNEEKELGLIPSTIQPSTGKIDATKGNSFELIPIEQNSDSKLAQKENDEAYYLKIVNSYMDKKEYKIAIEILDKAIALYPENSNFYAFRGLSYKWLNQHKKSIEDYTKAINLNPQNRNNMLTSIYYVRGLSYSELKQYEKAIADYSNSISLDPQNSESYFWRGSAYDELKQYQKAIEDFTKAINLNPQNGLYYAMRGNSFNRLNQPQNAKIDYIKAVNLFKKNGDIDNYNITNENLKGIEQNIASSQQINQEISEAYYLNIAYNLLREKKNKEAVEFFDKAISLNPRNPESYALRGNSYGNLRQVQKAKLDFIKAGNLFKKNGDTEGYNRIQEALKITEQNIAFLASENASKKRTRELLVKRACSMGKQGYTDGEIGNEIYRLVRINTPAPRRTASSFSYGRSYDSTTIAVMNLVMGLDELSAKYYDNVIENEASDIMQVAKKRCKF